VAPAANGRRQSPIDIKTKETLFDVKLGLRPLKMRYVPGNSKSVINNGHTVQVCVDGANSSKFLRLSSFVGMFLYKKQNPGYPGARTTVFSNTLDIQGPEQLYASLNPDIQGHATSLTKI
jgi:hypothetical protein